jgi:hypothetical protein
LYNASLVRRNPVATEHYVQKSGQFLHSMNILFDLDFDGSRAGIALLAIHSAIALNDAIQMGLLGKQSKYENHAQTLRQLKRICGERKIQDVIGIRHLKWLLDNKTDVSYGLRRLDPEFVKTARLNAERFNSWAYNMFREVLRDRTGAD